MQDLLGEFYPVRVTDKKTAQGVKATSSREAIFLDGDGDEIHRAVFRDGASLGRAMGKALGRYGPREIAWAPFDGKLPAEEKRPVVLAFADDKRDSADTLKALEDRTIAKLHGKFLFMRAAFRRDSEEAGKWGVTQAPAILVVDAAKGEALERASGRKGARELKALLQKALARGEKK